MEHRLDELDKKLEAFISKFYKNELIKGLLLFFAFGALYFIVMLLIEYFLWLGPIGRTILFWSFIAVELSLFVKLICIPVLRLLRIFKGIDHTDAARIIGNYFPEVNDKLINTLQLRSSQSNSELINASLSQRSDELKPIPFRLAINLKDNLSYLKYAALPLIIVILISLLGKDNILSSSYQRVINYNTAYQPPAPFSFLVVNNPLTSIEGTDFRLEVRTFGELLPNQVSVLYNEQRYFMEQVDADFFEFTFEQPSKDIIFQLEANDITSKYYTIEIVPTPIVTSFEMELNYPSHTGKLNDVYKNSGNATIPEGTTVTWKLNAKETTAIQLQIADSIANFSKVANATGTNQIPLFALSRKLFSPVSYAISTSNSHLENYENLSFSIDVIKDQYPTLNLQSKKDSINIEQTYFYGRATDDYGIRKIRLVYFQEGKDEREFVSLVENTNNVAQFMYAFPNDIVLEEGKNYQYYFEVLDNDIVNNYKSTKSTVFNYTKLSQETIEKEQLEQQDKVIQKLSQSLKQSDERALELEELSKNQKEKDNLSFNDQKKLESFLKRQESQESLMKQYSKQLKENLEEFQKEDPLTDEDKELLKERLERQELKAKQTEKLLKELQELREKMPKEELAEKLEELEKRNKNNKRNLEQMVELTKRYYVQKKAEQLMKELSTLAQKQEVLSKKSGEENSSEKQRKLSEEFDTINQELEALKNENNALKKPLALPNDDKKQSEISQEQENATSQLQKEKGSKDTPSQSMKSAQKSQQKAASKMKELSKSMEQQMQMSGEKALQEDAEMLRQILDNLMVFSFEEEALMYDFRKLTGKNPSYASKLRYQNILKQNFNHVDDSLYALALRQPKLDEIINESLVDIDYNLSKALERFAENEIGPGVSSQQYVINGANELADLLSESLDNMQNAMMSGSGKGSGQGAPMPGSGSGSGPQLPDIIQSQEELNGKMNSKPEDGSKGNSGSKESGNSGTKPGNESGDNEEGKRGNKDGKSTNSKDGNGSPNKPGDSGNSQEGSGSDGMDPGLVYEIYKQQSKLRQQLNDAIEREGLGDVAKKLSRKMEGVSQQLLEKGFSKDVQNLMRNLKHELMKLNDAVQEQGEDKQRESNTNKKDYRNTLNPLLDKAKEYFNTTEILSRKSLPLNPVYKQKVQDYFQKKNDSI